MVFCIFYLYSILKVIFNAIYLFVVSIPNLKKGTHHVVLNEDTFNFLNKYYNIRDRHQPSDVKVPHWSECGSGA